uniref:WD repeat-containing protein 74-like isoform n=1 Tax=Ornithogalum saundersiae TaxID=484171 RepID=A0A0A7LYS6_9ASPA|nr:WD repeat-containing protein 74-like isoform [Ornithogalum saundersiae]
MPRTTAVESPGCPPMRALTTDVLGLVKVIEARGKSGTPKVVETWGPPDASRGIIAASFADRETQPRIALARKHNVVEIMNPLNGHSLAVTKISESISANNSVDDDSIVGLHLFETKGNELSSRLNVLLTCTEKGKAKLTSVAMADPSSDSATPDSQSTWDVCVAGKVIWSSVAAHEKYALFGGKGIEMNVWDLDTCTKTWTSKPPPSNSLGIFSPTWFTAATFLSKEDHHKIAAGTNNHQVRLYDLSAQRRPVMSVNFRESPIKAVAADLDCHTVYVGTAIGDLASFDMRTGKLLGCFVGKCSGSIRSITRHPELPIIASCGLDSYLRIWDTKTRQLLSAVFLKQHLTNVVIDSHFSNEELVADSADQTTDLQTVEGAETTGDCDDEADAKDELLCSLGSKRAKKKERSKTKSERKRRNRGVSDDDQLRNEDQSSSLSEGDTGRVPALKRRRPLSEGKGRK